MMFRVEAKVDASPAAREFISVMGAAYWVCAKTPRGALRKAMLTSGSRSREFYISCCATG